MKDGHKNQDLLSALCETPQVLARGCPEIKDGLFFKYLTLPRHELTPDLRSFFCRYRPGLGCHE